MKVNDEKPKVRYHNGQFKPVAMFDSFSNLVANIGTMRDKRHHNQFNAAVAAYNWIEIEGAYLDCWIARQIVNVPIDDGLREWRSFNIEDSSAIEEEERRLKVSYNYMLANYWARLYGGSVILMITDQSLEEELDVKKIKKGSLHKLIPLDRWDVVPINVNYYDPVSEDYLKPEYYMLFGGRTKIHSSHVIRCDGEEIPRRLRALNQGWGDSTLRQVMEDVKDVVATKSGIASLVLEANVDTIQREGLSQELASGQESQILKRFALSGQLKSLVNTLLLDGNETYERKSVTFGGLAQIMQSFMTWTSGAADIPATRLFGRSPEGMNATGESDMRNYFNKVKSIQENKFTPDMRKLDQVLIRSATGEIPEEYSFEWNPLYQESGVELAQMELSKAQSDDIRLSQGVIKPSHAAMRLKQEGSYVITEEEINAMQEKEREEEEFENNNREEIIKGGFGLEEEEGDSEEEVE